MPVSDSQTGELSNLVYGADTTALQAGDQGSIFDGVYNFVTKAIPLTGVAVFNSFANSGITVANWLGADIEELSVDKQMESLGWQEYADYYNEHSQGIEAAGFLVGSLAPGLGAIKALKLAQAAKFGPALQRATNFMAGPRQKLIEDTLLKIADEGSWHNTLRADKLKAIALGFGDQALQALAYETATAATMFASPTFDKASLSDIASHIGFGMLLGGGIGGVLEGIATNRVFKKAIGDLDFVTKVGQVVTQYGYLESALSNGTTIAGDRASAILHSLAAIPESIFETTAGRKIYSSTENAAFQKARESLQTLAAGDDKSSADALWSVVERMFTDTGRRPEDAYPLLSRLVRTSRITEDTRVPVREGFYANHFTGPEVKGGAMTLDDFLSDVPHPGSNNTTYFTLRPLYGMGDIRFARFDTAVDVEGLTVGLYANSADAFSQGIDVFVNRRGQVLINPNSSVIEGRAPFPGQSRTLTAKEYRAYRATGELPPGSPGLFSTPLTLNIDKGQIVTKVVPVIGDAGVPRVTMEGVEAGNRAYTFSLADAGESITSRLARFDARIQSGEQDLIMEANARFVWAHHRGIQMGDDISSTDLPMLESLYHHLRSFGARFEQEVESLMQRGVLMDGDELPFRTEIELRGMIQDVKDDLIHTLSQNDSLSADVISRVTNTPVRYLENGGSATVPADLIIPIEDSMRMQHVNLTYDINRMTVQEGNIVRGIVDTQARIQVIKDAAEAAVAREFGENYRDFVIDLYKSAQATVEGVKTGFLSFANADYGTLGAAAQRVGAAVERLITARRNVAVESFAREAYALRANPQAFAEAAAFTAVRRRTSEAYVFLPEDLARQNWMSTDTVVLEGSLIRNREGAVVGWNKSYTPDGFYPGAAKVDPSANQWDSAYSLHTFYHLSPEVAAWERAQLRLNDEHIRGLNRWYAAQGINKDLRLGRLYAPPIDTERNPYFVYVTDKRGRAMGDGGSAIITARTAQELNEKIALIDRDAFDVFTKEELKKEHALRGQFEFDRNFMQSRVNTSLARKGILNDVVPEANVDAYLQEYVNHHARQETRRVRDFVELGNSQLFAEIDFMSRRFVEADTSRMTWINKRFNSMPRNPYESYIKTALGISDRETYPMWKDAQEKLEKFGDTAFNTVRTAFFRASQGQLSFEAAADTAKRFGLGAPYDIASQPLRAYNEMARSPADLGVVRNFVSRANSALGALAVRLDAFQSIINTIATPIMLFAEASSARQALLQHLATELPGTTHQVPANMKLVYQAISNWFNRDIHAQWAPIYERIGATRDISSDFVNFIDHVTLPYGNGAFARMNEQAGKIVESASRLTGARYSEQFTRFVAADTARQLFEITGQSGSQLLDNIMVFVNRVHGNYVASQRPIAFQGPVGQAIGMFQTYQLNLMQQLFRYVEDRDMKTIAIMMGLQGSIFGLQGLPGFQLINNAVIGNAPGNTGHGDVYSGVTSLMGKAMGDWILYGAASNVMGAGLYSRGDINPRQLTILPVNPLDYPAISGGINVLSNLLDTFKNIKNGGDVATSFLRGLEHNGLSRPLAGLAQLAQGYVTTRQGGLVSVTRGGEDGGWNDIISAANFSRVLGSRPLEEAIAMDVAYRSTTYRAKDNQRIQALGEAVKSHLYGGNMLSEDAIQRFSASYAAAGGDITQFGQSMMRWIQDANVSVANQAFRHLEKPLNQNMMRIMGGQPLPDYRNTASMNGPTVAGLTPGMPQ